MNGLCDASGGCQRYAPGTQCSAPKCQGATLTGAGTCNTQGACLAPIQSCAPAMCSTDGTSCQPPCSDAACPANFYCVSADLCVPKKVLGAWCGSAHECLSNICAGGLDGGPGHCTALLP